ncbi:hypothetical protein BDW69DRAFT_154166 [Aspergillus filifer]
MTDNPGLSVTIRRNVSEENLKIIKDSDNAQQKFHAYVKRSRKYHEGEKKALELTSIDDTMKSLARTKCKYDEQRKYGVKRLQKRTAESAAAFSDILDNMRSILEATKNLAAPFGGLAVGTVCFFFTVAKNRVAMETQISETFLEIRDRLPALKMYEHIYNSNTDLEQRVQSKIVQAYAAFMSFFMSATKFYVGGSKSRWFRALGQPTELADDIAKVKGAVVEIRLCCEEILDRNIHNINNETKGLRMKIADLEKEIRDLKETTGGLQEKNINSKLFNIRESLGLGTYKMEDEIQRLRKYGTYLPKDLSQNQDALARKQDDYLKSFRNENPIFQSWRSSSHSRMLILSGYNQNHQFHQCWLSPIALHMIEGLLEKNDEPYAFYVLGHSDNDSLCRVLSCLIVQLLASNLHILNKEGQYSDLRDAVNGYKKARAEQTQAVEQVCWLERALVGVLNMFNPVTAVWIVLDRVDKCTPTSKYRESKRLLKTLVRVIKATKVNVRVLAVVNGWNLREEQYEDDLEETKTGTVEIYKGEQDLGY